MIGPSTQHLIALVASAALAVALAVYAWRRRPAPGAASFVVLALALIVWALASALRLSSADLSTQVLWTQVRYASGVVAPAAWLAFTLQYTGRSRWLTPHTIALLCIEPVVVLLLAWTNESHHLIWTGPALDTSPEYPTWWAAHNVGYWFHVAYSYLLLASGALLLGLALLRPPRSLPRRQIAALLIGTLLVSILVPVVGNVPSAVVRAFFPYFDLLPVALVIAGLVGAWALSRARLFDLVPVARDAAIESMSDGVIVLDAQDRVVGVNPAAQRLLGRPAADIIGQPAAQAFAGQMALFTHLGEVTEGHVEIPLETGESPRVFDLSISPLRNRRGRLILVHDITEHKQAFQLAQRRAAELDMLNDVGRALAGTLNVDELLEIIYQQVQRVLYADNLCIALCDEASEMIHFAFVVYQGKRQPPVWHKAGPEGLTEHVIRTRQPLFLQGDIEVAARAVGAIPRNKPTGPQTRAWLGVPLVCGEQTLGVLSIQHHEDPHVYDETQVRLLQAVANQAALALRNAQLFKEIENERRIAEALAHLAQIVNSTLDLNEVLRLALEQLASVVAYDSATIFLAEGSTLTVLANRGFSDAGALLGQAFPMKENGVVQNVLHTRQTQIVPDAQQIDEWTYYQDNVRIIPPIRAWIGAPLVIQCQSIGLLTADKYEPDFYTAEDKETVTAFATQIATAMQNARLYQAVQRAHNQLTAILRDATDAVIVLDQAGRVVLLNPAAEKYLAVRFPQVAHQPLAALGLDRLSEVLAAGPALQEIAGPGGRTLYVSVSPVRDVGWVVVMQDITPLKELDRLRTEWVAAVSHDMKSPLSAIQLSAHLLEKIGPLTPDQRQVLGLMGNSIARLRSLVVDVLDLALLGAGPALPAGSVDLYDVVAEAHAEVEPLVAAKGQTLSADLPAALPAVWGNKGLLTRALVNLLNNAAKYTPAGGQVTVRTRLQDGAVRVEVSDTGPGIPAEALPHIFDRFYRVPGTEGDSESWGLGLSIVKAIVEKHGGRAWAESEVGRGSTFGFTVPIREEIAG